VFTRHQSHDLHVNMSSMNAEGRYKQKTIPLSKSHGLLNWADGISSED